MTRRFYPVAEPVLAGNERAYVLDCLETGWISGSGRYVTTFEERFAAFCGVRHAISVANGTAALHLALLAMDIARGDEVIIPDLTYVASANAVRYCGATPVFADVDPVTFTLDPRTLAERLTPATKAIMPVHLYGHPTEIGPLLELARPRKLAIVEDAAEAHGAEYEGRRAGALGDIAIFSFFGNKIITTGEGGMVTTDDDDVAARVRLLRGQGMDPQRRYWFPVVGYNYRMTNVQAAIGVAQLERIDWFVERRREVASWYARHLSEADLLLPAEADWAKNVFWLYSVCVPAGVDRDQLIEQLASEGIETRPFYHPLHRLPPYAGSQDDRDLPVATDLASRGISLPSSATLDEYDVAHISGALERALVAQRGSSVDKG